MILVDTSVWIDHLRNGSDALGDLLNEGEVACHPLVIGELACGNLQQRKDILSLLHALPTIGRVSDDEVLFFIEKHRLYGRGLGLIDIHLLASCSVGHGRLWTLDNRLHKAATDIGIGT